MPIRWLLIFWMFAISAISFLDRVNISIAGRFIQQEFHITDLQLGNVFSAFLVGYALFPAANRLVANWIPPRERGLANGIIFAGVGVGAGTPPPLVTHIVLHYGWRASFWISAVIGLAAGVVWYWLAPGRPQGAPLGSPHKTPP